MKKNIGWGLWMWVLRERFGKYFSMFVCERGFKISEFGINKY